MHNYQISEMCDRLVKAGLVSDPVQAQKVLEDYWADKIAIVWDIEDVKDTIAEWKEVEIDAISDQTALEVLQTVFDKHDRDYGVTWETIRARAWDLDAREIRVSTFQIDSPSFHNITLLNYK